MPRRTPYLLGLCLALVIALPVAAHASVLQDGYSQFMSGTATNVEVGRSGTLEIKGIGIQQDTLAFTNVGIAGITSAGGSLHTPWYDYCGFSGDWGRLVDVEGCYAGYKIWGVKEDGTVVRAFHPWNFNYDTFPVPRIVRESNFLGWRDIVAIADSRNLALGLKKDGTVVAGYSRIDSGVYPPLYTRLPPKTPPAPDHRYDVGEWTDVVDIAVCDQGSYGLKADGTVLASEIRSWSRYQRAIPISRWRDIVDIEIVYDSIPFGVTKDGKVRHPLNLPNPYGEKTWYDAVNEWTDIVDVAGTYVAPVIAGLKSNGTVVYTSTHLASCSELSHWRDVVALHADAVRIVGVRSDGGIYCMDFNDSFGAGFGPLQGIVSSSTRSRSGVYESATLDSGCRSAFDTISWDSTVPAGCTLRFQLASNSGDGAWDYVGPDGTANTYYVTSGQRLWSGHSGHRYVRYRSYMTSDSRLSPSLGSLEIEHHPYDVTPPVTEASLAGTAGGNGWYRSAVIVSLTATEEGSGVAGTEYSVNGGATWAPYAAPFVLNAEGDTALMYRSTDVVGNVEQPRSAEIRIDWTAPAVSILSPAQGATCTPNSAVMCVWSATDSGSGVAETTGPASGAYLDTSNLGDHDVTVAAADAAGNLATATVRYSVRYPVLNPSTPFDSRALRAGAVKGSVLLLKIVIPGYDPSWPVPSATLYVAPVAADGSIGAAVLAPTSSGQSGSFRFDTAISTLLLNLSTKTLAAGNWELTVVMSDGARYSARLNVLPK